MLLSLDFSSDVPIYLQIRNQIVVGISNDILVPGEKLPTVRSLALETGINTMTVNKAYQLLKQEGYIIADRRNGAKVNPVFTHSKKLPEKALAALEVVASEAKLNGFSENEFMDLCKQLYEKSIQNTKERKL